MFDIAGLETSKQVDYNYTITFHMANARDQKAFHAP